MLYVLNPAPVSLLFNLNDALQWVAYRHYATNWNFILPDGEQESITDSLFADSWDAAPFFEDKDYENILKEKLGVEMPEDLSPLGDPYELYPSISNEEASTLAAMSIKAYDEYKAEIESIDNYCLSPYRSELFLRLRNGEITAYGQKREELKKGVPKSSWTNDESWEEIEYKSDKIYMRDMPALESGKMINGFQKIDPNFWDATGVIWDANFARSHLSCYHWIFVRSDQLFSCFPQPAGEQFVIEERAGFIVYDDEKASSEAVHYSKSTRGRPSFNWPEFHAEVANYCLKLGGIPPLQKNIEHHMQGWCQNNWGKVPSHGAMQKQLCPIYKKLKKSENEPA